MELKRGGVPDFIQLIPKSPQTLLLLFFHTTTWASHTSPSPVSVSPVLSLVLFSWAGDQHWPTSAISHRGRCLNNSSPTVIPVPVLHWSSSPAPLLPLPCFHSQPRPLPALPCRHLKTLHRQSPVPNSSFPLWFEKQVCGKVKNLNPSVSRFQLFGCINFGW